MTAPRHFVPGHSWSISRETLLGCSRMPPDADVTAILEFLLLYAAKTTKVRLHGFSGVPSRTRYTVTDRQDESAMADFLRTFHQLVATHLGHWYQATPGPFWCPSGLKVKNLRGPETILQDIVDTLLDPAREDLCERPMA